jgi:hypothetical protein
MARMSNMATATTLETVLEGFDVEPKVHLRLSCAPLLFPRRKGRRTDRFAWRQLLN